MIETLGLLLVLTAGGVASVVFTVRPLWRRGRVPAGLLAARDGAIAERKELALTALLELERDYRVGNLIEDDYRNLRRELEARAVHLMKVEDERVGALEATIEQDVARLRARLRAVGLPAPAAARSCRRCDHRPGRDDHFCAGCGAALPPVSPAPPPAAAVADGGPAWAVAAEPPAPVPPADRRIAGEVSARPRRPAAPWLAGGAALVLTLLAGVLWLYLASPSRVPQQPVATLPTRAVRALAILPDDPSFLLVAAEGGVLTSADGGRSWQPLGVRGDATSVVASGTRPSAIYVGGRGSSTEAAPAAVTGAGPALPARSLDRGRTWTALGRQGLPSAGLPALAVDPTNASVLYAAAGTDLVRSTDGGDSWTRLGAGLPAETTALVAVPGGPNAAATVFAATVQEGVLARADGGAGWANASGFVNGALPTRRVLALAYDPNSGDSYLGPTGNTFRGALYAATDRGLFKSIDAGTSWNRLPLEARLAAVAVSPLDARVVFAVDDGGRLFRSDDRGLTWPGAAPR